MIVYFADRQLNILGQASTELPKGLVVKDDLKTEDIESGVAVFECSIPFNNVTRALVESCTKPGNYILRSYDDANEFYTIAEREIDTKRQEVLIYAEDAGLDLLNEIVEAYEADAAYPISHYIELFAYDSGFEIGINEASDLTRKLSWDGEATAAERIASVATQFDGCEISYSFAIKGLEITNKYINIYRERGKDIGANLRLNEDIDKIVTKESIINLATALKCTGGTPDQTTDILEVLSDAGTPQVMYKVSLETLSRTANSAKISASVSASPDAEDAKFGKGYVITASVFMGGTWHDVVLKETDEEWNGTAGQTKELEFTLSGLSAAAITYKDIKFKVTRSDNGTAGALSEKACAEYVLTNYIAGGENGEGIADRPMTLEGYAYDDEDFYIDGTYLKSRKALEKWSRYSWTKEPNQTEAGGHITRPFSYDTLSQQTLLEHALTELKRACEMEVNYEIDINKLPENIKIGDRINIIDDAGELYVSARVLKLEVSVADQEQKATLGEFLIKNSGISAKVEQLANQFASASASAARALEVAKKANVAASSAQSQVDAAVKSVEEAQKAVEEVADVVEEAKQSAANAQTAADNAQAIVDSVEERVGSMETTVANAQKAADDAFSAAETAWNKADDAATAAGNAQADANTAKTNAETAITTANTASQTAATAYNLADISKTQAQSAYDTANAAKLDAEQAEKDVAALGERLETVSNTMEADYTRKTDLTETTAHLQTQISQNAAKIQLHAESLVTIDETTNNAYELAKSAQGTANAAQDLADQATTDAQAAKTAAEEATAAANAARGEADKAKDAADTAKSALEQAEADLAAAQADLATITSRVGATEEEIAAARKAVDDAKAAANQAKQDAADADQKAKDAQDAADAAAGKADAAKDKADEAADLANTAQQAANEAKGEAEEAKKAAFDAGTAAANAQITANQAVADADAAKKAAAKADEDAKKAVADAEAADKAAAQAAANLVAAKKRLAEVQADANSTQAQITAAQSAVNNAQAAVDAALASASEAAAYAAQAAIDAENAREAAAKADAEAKTAQAAAKEAKDKADEAFEAAGELADRVVKCEADILTTSQNITLYAKKTEVAEQLNGYYTKEEAQAQIKVEAEQIASQVEATDDLGRRASNLEQRADGFDVSIADSAKTATAFMSYDATNHLQIGNKQSESWSGSRVKIRPSSISFVDESDAQLAFFGTEQISLGKSGNYRAQVTPTAFNILNESGVVAASYGASKIELGKDNQDTVIGFCADKATLHHDSVFDWTQFKSNAMQIIGDKTASLLSGVTSGNNQYEANIYAYSGTLLPNVSISAGIYENGTSNKQASNFKVGYDGVVAESGDSIRLVAPLTNIEGDGNVTGELSANSASVSGALSAASASVTGKVSAGSAGVTGALTAASATVSGALSANSATVTNKITAGSAGVTGALTAGSATISGALNAGYTTLTGGLDMYKAGLNYIDFHYDTTANNGIDYTQRIEGASAGLNLYHGIAKGVKIMSDRFRSTGNKVHYLGDASNLWTAVYADNNVIQTSDRNRKKNIESIDDRYVALFDKLQPVSFEFNDAESDRVHIGFISQDVKEAMDEVGLTDLEFGGYCRDIKMETVEVEDPETGEISQVEREVQDENGNPVYLYSLRYSEFIALNSKMIQMNRQKIAEQEKEIQTLRDELAALKETVALLVGRDKEA